VEQVLRNLVSNAAKYGAVGSAVTVTAQETGAEVEIRVLDEGVGIDPEEAGRLFNLYYRSPRTARQTAGAGIGLFVCRGLVTAMGGRVWATPRPGGGSEFGFSLARCDDDRIPGEAHAPTPDSVTI
jgi:signal transduction histidine kinase